MDAATIVNDTMYNLVTALSQSEAFQTVGSSLSELNDGEKYELIREASFSELKYNVCDAKGYRRVCQAAELYHIRGVKYRVYRHVIMCGQGA